MDSRYIENFARLRPAEKAAVLAVYQQQTKDWVKVGAIGYVLQDDGPPKKFVRKKTLRDARSDVRDEIAGLGYATRADIESLLEVEKATLGYDLAADEYRRRRRTLKRLKTEEQGITDLLAKLV